MKTTSLNQSIFRLVVSLVIITCLTILANVWVMTFNQAQNKLAKDLKLAQEVLGEVIDNQEQQLFTSASVLTDDFGFKQAVASNDNATITSVLSNHGNRISADLMAILNLNGDTIASTLKSSGTGEQQPLDVITMSPELVESSLEEGGISTFMSIDNRIYKVISLRIDAPTPMAIALVGFELTPQFIANLEKTTHIKVSLLVNDKVNGTFPLVIENKTQLGEDSGDLLQVTELSWHHIAFTKDTSVTQEFLLFDDNSMRIQVVLTQQLKMLISEFSQLKENISIIVLIAIIIASVAAMLFSRRLARPIMQLASVAQQISSGNYRHQAIKIGGSREFQHLSTAFTNMQNSISEREKEITFQAQHDPLTGLYTRYYARDVINRVLTSANQQKCVFQAIGINIYGFREINDVFGYQYGDICLTSIANRIKQLGGLSARLAGGEFLWVPNFDTQTKHAYISDIKLREIKEVLEQPIVHEGVAIPLKMVLGTLNCPAQASDAEQLYRKVNIVLDEAKLQPTLTLHYQDEYEQKYIRRLQIITRLKTALNENSPNLFLYYQPKLNIRHQKVDALEALIRWIDPELGFVPPDEFIGIAESAGLISQVTNWVIERAIRDAQQLAMQCIDVCIAINLSATDIINPYLLDKIASLLKQANLPTHALSFEITESDLVEDPKKAVTYLNNFKAQGYELAIDDFGTGYSSLAYLKSFPVNTLKIDKSFILKLSQDQDDRDIVETIMQLAQKFNLNVVAEGVEDAQSLAILADLDCTWAQGFHLCRPIPLSELIEWMKANQHTTWLAPA